MTWLDSLSHWLTARVIGSLAVFYEWWTYIGEPAKDYHSIASCSILLPAQLQMQMDLQ